MIYISRIVIALVFYTMIVLALLATKPSLMFDAEGVAKPFGLGLKDGTNSPFAPAIMFPLLAIIMYIISSVTVFVLV